MTESFKSECIATISHLNTVFSVYATDKKPVPTAFSHFKVYEPLEILIEQHKSQNQKSLSKNTAKYVKKVLKQHFKQAGVYFSDSPLIASSDFKNDDKMMLWSSGNRYCVLGFISGNIFERRTPGYQGKRFFNRGCDDDARAGNQLLVQYVENDDYTSNKPITCVRGQMPIKFQQIPNMKVKPKPTILENDHVFSKYMTQMAQLKLENLVFFNLVDNKPWESFLAKNFQDGVIEYLDQKQEEYEIYEISKLEADQVLDLNEQPSFKFSQLECKKLKFTKINKPKYEIGILIISKNMSYVHLDYHKTISKGGKEYANDLFKVFEQIYKDGYTPRINCVDSLDRTNCFLLYYYQYRNFNQSNDAIIYGGNVISNQYASSNAMKQDLARFGKRTNAGKMQDLAIWFRRAIFNNLIDGKQQDAYRLIQQETRLTIPNQFNYIVVFLSLLVILIAALISIILKAENNVTKIVSIVFCCLICLAAQIGTILGGGKKFAELGKF
ncbi:Phosphatidylinositol_4-phosphatase [Hexamita inflata]|uniref:Phosphatidylinositol_4-phosphatase n=1 Tax=Hexamita inflata TaxID=28002 RepID=A0ABP1HWE1_9EUKA